MPTPETLKALLFATLLAATTLGATASAEQVYFVNDDSGSTQVVDVYVDGTLLFDDVLAGSSTMSPREIGSGQHQIVVTPANVAPGQQDLLSQVVNIQPNTAQTLTFDWGLNDENVREFSLAWTPGLEDAE